MVNIPRWGPPGKQKERPTMEESLCTITRERLLMLIHQVEIMNEVFLDHMTMFNEASRVKFMEARNRIHAILLEGVKEGGQP